MSFTFLSFPVEIRHQIYRELLVVPGPLVLPGLGGPATAALDEAVADEDTPHQANQPPLHPAILTTCRGVSTEALRVLYGANTFALPRAARAAAAALDRIGRANAARLRRLVLPLQVSTAYFRRGDRSVRESPELGPRSRRCLQAVDARCPGVVRLAARVVAVGDDDGAALGPVAYHPRYAAAVLQYAAEREGVRFVARLECLRVELVRVRKPAPEPKEDVARRARGVGGCRVHWVLGRGTLGIAGTRYSRGGYHDEEVAAVAAAAAAAVVVPGRAGGTHNGDAPLDLGIVQRVEHSAAEHTVVLLEQQAGGGGEVDYEKHGDEALDDGVGPRGRPRTGSGGDTSDKMVVTGVKRKRSLSS